MIYGHAGTGKTTFARRLEVELPGIRFSHDEWMVQLYGTDPPEALFSEYAARVSGLIDDLWPQLLKSGSDVVLDLGFWSRQSRDQARSMASEIGHTVKLYHLSCSADEAWLRIEQRNLKLERSLLITRPTFDLLRTRVEPLGADEPYVEVLA